MRIKGARVSNPNDFVTSSGSRMRDICIPVVSDEGVINVVKDSEFDFQDYIESFRSQTDMAWILNQLQLGNTAVLQAEKGMYGDFSEFPKTYAEILQLNIDAHKMFDNLDIEIKKKYGMDFNRWFADFGSEDWIKVMKNNSDVEITEGPIDQIVNEVKE